MHIGEVPCGRSSFLSGIAGGVGIGFIRGLATTPFVAANWAFGTWLTISISSWYICNARLEKQHELTRMAIQNIPKQLRLKKEDDKETTST
ncbi:hypothetical protein FB451DRAFT_1051369 [Mycena latifolia]|nr:hypothetical protein FB451DRAFT_1051369 [Mycena latifolia]